MAATQTSDLSGFFYEVYGEHIDLIPKSTKFVSTVPFEKGEKQIGNKFHVNVLVQEESGFTHAAAGAGAYTLQGNAGFATQDAQVDGYQFTLQAQMDYETAAKASSSKKAFAEATGKQVQNMLESSRRRLEALCWYGQSGLGQVSSTANSSATKTVLQLSTASWAPLIWAGSKGRRIVAYNGSSLVSSGSDAIFTVYSVDIANRKITVTGTATGITAIDALSGTTLDLYFYTAVSGSLSYAEAAGVNKILTTSGTIFNIDNTAHDVWAGNSYSAGSAPLNFNKVQSALAVAVGRGLDEDVDLFVNPRTWANLASDMAALRRIDASYSVNKGENGVKSIEFHYAAGSVAVHSNGYIKEGDAFVLPMKRWHRIGATDVSFKTPGRQNGDDIFLHTTDKAGFEYRLYSHQAIYCEAPSRCIKISSIVNN